jgi:hypothetical protein
MAGSGCVVTVHGIGFQQPPKDGTPGYADALHKHLREPLARKPAARRSEATSHRRAGVRLQRSGRFAVQRAGTAGQGTAARERGGQDRAHRLRLLAIGVTGVTDRGDGGGDGSSSDLALSLGERTRRASAAVFRRTGGAAPGLGRGRAFNVDPAQRSGCSGPPRRPGAPFAALHPGRVH